MTARLGTLGMLMHCFGAATALTLVHYLDFWGQLAAITAGGVLGFYATVRASECVVMSTVSAVSLRGPRTRLEPNGTRRSAHIRSWSRQEPHVTVGALYVRQAAL